ncbi:MAG: radical SAM protein [Anaerolineales bacterium]|nr:radical SAM protein [Anaerolineales bacterium]
MFTYLSNLLKLTRGDFTLDPHIAVYYVTMQCNLNCAYCEDFGSRRNHLVTPAPSLENTKHILKVIRTGIDRLWLTGGEPLMHPQILDLLQYARQDLKFKDISLITNGTLLSERLKVDKLAHSNGPTFKPSNLLTLLDNLIISLDSTDPQALSMVSVPDAYAETVIANAREAASLQKEYNFKLILNAVITPETLPSMDKLIVFCTENNAHISFSPQSVNNLPRYELVTSPAYRAFIEKVIELKEQGAPIVGSYSYFKSLLDQTPYECYPTLVPRIMPDGWLAYPCRPMEKAGGEQGGRAVNLLSVNTWDEAWTISKKRYGEAPTSCVSCFQQCYAEPSLMQAHPFEYLSEKVRGNELIAYVPG